MYDNSQGATDNASVFDTVHAYRSAMSETERVVQGGHRSNHLDEPESV